MNQSLSTTRADLVRATLEGVAFNSRWLLGAVERFAPAGGTFTAAAGGCRERWFHTATLLHDDVVDESALRRGRSTANALFGNAASVLVGDFVYSRAFQMMVSVNRMRVLEVLADATNGRESAAPSRALR